MTHAALARIAGGASVWATLLALSAAASATETATYFCEAQATVGYQAQLIDDWRDGMDKHGQIRFEFEPDSGAYRETFEGSAAAITDLRTLTVVRRPGEVDRTVVAMSEHGAIVLRIEDNAHGVFYTRLGDEGLAEIGTCEKR